ncbi:MAG: tRNA (adenosine(37)-N6)-dimethylallyltransferase MiaA [Bacteroidales bacterium]|nr:tRNA (adenosine(37)-N6)-dimethylallyltransferase MiaA [Bacteroidales bacterium]
MYTGRYDLIAVAGPTAGGKTAFAAHLADVLDGEIISADSRQVYRKMDIGTGKDTQDYRVNDRLIPCHLIDIAEPGERYNLFEYQRDFFTVWKDIRSREKVPVLCGGSGLYIAAVTRSYKLLHVPVNTSLRKELEQKPQHELADMLHSMKKLHNKTDVDTRAHAIRAIEIEVFRNANPDLSDTMPVLNTLFIGIRFERAEERRRITERLYKRLEQGLVNEVRSLLHNGLAPEDLMYYGLEYKYVTMYLSGRITYDDMVSRLNTAIHQFAKRQMTWFRKMEREGTVIHWIDGSLSMEEKLERAIRFFHQGYGASRIQGQ